MIIVNGHNMVIYAKPDNISFDRGTICGIPTYHMNVSDFFSLQFLSYIPASVKFTILLKI